MRVFRHAVQKIPMLRRGFFSHAHGGTCTQGVPKLFATPSQVKAELL